MDSAVREAQNLLPKIVRRANHYVQPHREDFEEELQENLQDHQDDLAELLRRRKAFLEETFTSDADIVQRRKRQQVEAAEKMFEDFEGWITSAMTMGDSPYVEVIAVLIGR